MFDSTKPATGGSLVAADIRENFRALKEDDIVDGITRSIIAGTGLSGGGQMNADRTLSHAAHTGDVTGTTALTIAASAVSQAKLKTSTGSVSAAAYVGATNLTLPGGEYGFYPQVTGNITAQIAYAANLSYYITNICLTAVGSSGVFAQQRYVTSSGEVFWIFILRDKVTKDIISIWQAPDHPCFGNGGKPLLVPHPFPDYDETKHEIIVINPSHEEVEAMKKLGERGEDEPDKDLLEVIMEEYEIDEDSKPAWPTKAVTVGLPKDYETKKMGEGVQPIKKAIPRPPYIKTKSLRRKA